MDIPSFLLKVDCNHYYYNNIIEKNGEMGKGIIRTTISYSFTVFSCVVCRITRTSLVNLFLHFCASRSLFPCVKFYHMCEWKV